MNQWAFHGRLYRAFEAVATRPDTELVQLVSFGCGIDAITSEQMKRIAHENKSLYTMLKIDETDTLGAARIRLRSLFAVHGVEIAPQPIEELPDFVEPKDQIRESPIRFFSRFLSRLPPKPNGLRPLSSKGSPSLRSNCANAPSTFRKWLRCIFRSWCMCSRTSVTR